MKATQFNSPDGRSEILLEDGRSFSNKKNEDSDALYVRVAGIVDEETMDVLDTKVVDSKSLKRNAKTQLLKLHEKATSALEISMIEEILTSREVEFESKIVDPIPAPEKEKSEKPEISDEEIEARIAKYKENIGKMINFTTRNGVTIRQPIESIRFDKRTGSIFYLVTHNGKITGKTVWSKHITVEP